MDIILTGATGKLGAALWRSWTTSHRVRSLGRDCADLRHPERLSHALEGMDFDVLVNCAAMAGLEDCEAHPDEAHLVNCEAPGALAALCRERGARFVHISTDYVLDGREEGLKDETAPTRPLGHYAATKLAGEHRVLEQDPSALVCRVSWLFGTEPPGFLETVLARARAGEELEAVADKFSMPTSVDDIATLLVALLDHRAAQGVVHLINQGEPESWWSYARRVLALAVEVGLLEQAGEVRPRKLSELPGLTAARPVHTAMRPGRLGGEFRLPPRRWEEAARERLEQLLV